jgi:hypothetical protein
MRKLIAQFRLRNLHSVYKEGTDFEISHVDPHGTVYTQTVSAAAADRLFELCSGKTVSVQGATGLIAPEAYGLLLPYQYGFKLEYYVQGMLLVLAATKRATFGKVGRKYFYIVQR